MKEERICNNCYKEAMRSQILDESRTPRYTKHSPDRSQTERPVTPDTVSTRSFAGYSQQDVMNSSFTSSIVGSLTPRSMQLYTVTPLVSYNNPPDKEEFEKKMQELENYTKTKDEEVMNLIENLKKEKETSDSKAAEIEHKLEAMEHELTEKVDKMAQLNNELNDLRGKYDNDKHQVENLVKRIEDNQHENTEILKKLNTQTHGLQTDYEINKEEFYKSYKEMLEAQHKILEENRLLSSALKESTENITQLQHKIQELQNEIKSEEKKEIVPAREDNPNHYEFNILEQEIHKQRNELEILKREINNRKPSKDYNATNSCSGCIIL